MQHSFGDSGARHEANKRISEVSCARIVHLVQKQIPGIIHVAETVEVVIRERHTTANRQHRHSRVEVQRGARRSERVWRSHQITVHRKRVGRVIVD